MSIKNKLLRYLASLLVYKRPPSYSSPEHDRHHRQW